MWMKMPRRSSADMSSIPTGMTRAIFWERVSRLNFWAMPYCCKTCGSLVVYHHCRPNWTLCAPSPAVACTPTEPAGVAAVSVAATDSSVTAETPAAAPQRAGQPSEKHCDSPVVAFKACDVPGCCRVAAKYKNGRRWGKHGTFAVRGDHVCLECYERLTTIVEDNIPRPPGWPAGYYVARLRDRRTVDKETAVTLLWCYGKLIKAAELKSSARASRVRVDSLV